MSGFVSKNPGEVSQQKVHMKWLDAILKIFYGKPDICIYIYIYVCVCARVRACVRACVRVCAFNEQ